MTNVSKFRTKEDVKSPDFATGFLFERAVESGGASGSNRTSFHHELNKFQERDDGFGPTDHDPVREIQLCAEAQFSIDRRVTYKSVRLAPSFDRLHYHSRRTDAPAPDTRLLGGGNSSAFCESPRLPSGSRGHRKSLR
jgi:hypothetical protein